jgi:hypothetical protein
MGPVVPASIADTQCLDAASAAAYAPPPFWEKRGVEAKWAGKSAGRYYKAGKGFAPSAGLRR